MARITVQDCMDKVYNRFELVALTAQRAKNINSGAVVTINRDNDKPSVLALREIALGHVKPDALREGLIRSLQTVSRVDSLEEVALAEGEEIENFDYIPEGSDLFMSDSSPDDESVFDEDTQNIEEQDFK